MACVDCGNCVLISSECLCQYTPMKGIDLNKYSDVIEDANADLITSTVCDLCEGYGEEGYKYQAVLDSPKFRRYYAKLIYYHWLINYGSGKASENGVISKAADEFSDFRVHSGNEIQGRIKVAKEQIQAAEKIFTPFFSELFPNCGEEASEEACGKCGENKCCCPTQSVYKGSSLSVFGLDGEYPDCAPDEFGSF